MLIKVTKEHIALSTKFSEDVVNTNRYSYRSQHNQKKIQGDILTGKIGEYAVYQFLASHFTDVTPVDINIYKGRAKSHSADLTVNGLKIAIKTQSMRSATLYGSSWMIETKSLEKHSDQLFVTCLQLSESEILIQNIATYDEVVNNLSKPKLEYLKTKSAIYIEDLLISRIKRHIIDETGTDSLILEA